MPRTIKNLSTMLGQDTLDPFTAYDAYDEAGHRWTIGPNQKMNFPVDLADTLLGNVSGVQNKAAIGFAKAEDGLDTKTLIT